MDRQRAATLIWNNSQVGTELFLDSRVRIVRLDSMPEMSALLEQRPFLRSIEAALREMLALPDNELAALYAESVLLRGGPADEAKVQGTNRNQTTVTGVPAK